MHIALSLSIVSAPSYVFATRVPAAAVMQYAASPAFQPAASSLLYADADTQACARAPAHAATSRPAQQEGP